MKNTTISSFTRKALATSSLALLMVFSACSNDNDKSTAAGDEQTSTSTSASASDTASQDKVVATINGVEITQRQLSLVESDLGQQFAQLPAEDKQAAVLNAMLDIQSLALKAKKEGLDKDANYMARLNFLKARILHDTYYQETILSGVTDEKLQQRYDIEVKTYPSTKEVHARHILVDNEEAALEIIKLLDEGGDFVALAKEKSTGPSGPKGGDLGFFGKGQMVPEFDLAVFAMNKGDYSKTPVKTQFGYHIIKMEDERLSTPPSFEEVKEQLRQTVAREHYFNQAKEARESYSIEVLDENLKSRLDSLLAQMEKAQEAAKAQQQAQ